MGEVIAFPNRPDRDFKEFEYYLRGATELGPCDPAVWDKCISEVREHWERIYEPLTFSINIETDPPLLPSQNSDMARIMDNFAKQVERQIVKVNGMNVVIISRLLYERTALELSR